jgi:hypothetical protein
MRVVRPVLAAILLAASAAPVLAQPPPGTTPPGPAPEPPPPVEEPPPAGTTTEIWREPTPPLDLGFHLFALPETIVELALSPIAFTVGLVQRYRVDKRVYDLLRNDAGTVKVVPAVKFSGGDGYGMGAALELEDLMGRGEELEVGGLMRLNRDWEASTRYRQTVPALEGRLVSAQVRYELDQNLKYYGIGTDTEPEDRRVIKERTLGAELSSDVFRLGALQGGGRMELGYRRVGLGPGLDATEIPLGEPGDMVEPTADFGRTSNYARGAFTLYYDDRDRVGRSTVGSLTEISGGLAVGMDGADLNAGSGSATWTGFMPVLPLRRVLVFSVGVAGVTALTSNGSVPLGEMVLLDRKRGLRGYSTGRFRYQLGWQSSLEYRYPIWEYQDTKVALSPVLFVDAGQVGGAIPELFDRTPRWSTGIGMRAEHDTRLLGVIELGFSPEGYELGFNLGKEL